MAAFTTVFGLAALSSRVAECADYAACSPSHVGAAAPTSVGAAIACNTSAALIAAAWRALQAVPCRACYCQTGGCSH